MLWITVSDMLNARIIATELLKTVRESEPIHWSRRENLHAMMQVADKRILK